MNLKFQTVSKNNVNMKKLLVIILLITPLVISNVKAYYPENTSVDGVKDREYWVKTIYKISYPVLDALSRESLKKEMPVEEHPGTGRADYAYLEAMGRLLCGLAPWFELGPDNTKEGQMRSELLSKALKGIAYATDPLSPEYMNFTKGGQPLVDAAFLAHAFVRSPVQLWGGLDDKTKANVIKAFKLTRRIKPGYSNWLLFSGMIEAFFLQIGEEYDPMRLDYAITKHKEWYKGDGVYGDGPDFHWDYYNSFVIQPMMVDILKIMSSKKIASEASYKDAVRRASRYAAIQERLISPEGTYPPIGRSLPYRIGAFQALAHITLDHALPKEVHPAQVRSALTAVMKRQMEAPGTFDKKGWLQLGFCGHQPGVAETYLCTGSLYLCSVGFLPLGLPAGDPFWNSPAMDWTSKKAWSGSEFPIDKAIGN